MHTVLFNRLVELAQEKSVVRLTDRLDMTIADDWDVPALPYCYIYAHREIIFLCVHSCCGVVDKSLAL